MKRIHVIIPTALTLAFVIYYIGWAPRSTTFHFVGESPSWFGRHEISVRPPITTKSGDEYEGRDGAREALEDLRAGKVALLGYGLPPLWEAERKEILRRDFDIDSRDVAGCIVTETLVKYVAGYNRVMEAHILARFGSDIFDIVAKRARGLYNERHPEAAEKG